jgi:hypothetical protein
MCAPADVWCAQISLTLELDPAIFELRGEPPSCATVLCSPAGCLTCRLLWCSAEVDVVQQMGELLAEVRRGARNVCSGSRDCDGQVFGAKNAAIRGEAFEQFVLNNSYVQEVCCALRQRGGAMTVARVFRPCAACSI